MMQQENSCVVCGMRHKKSCVVCGRTVYPGTGTYHRGKLVHKTCKGIFEAYWNRYI